MPEQNPPTKYTVIWDLDGVIVDTAPFHFRAWKRVSEDWGIGFDENTFKLTFGMRNPEIIRIVFGKDIPDSKIVAVSQSKENYYRQLMAGKVDPLPGAVELLGDLRAAGFHQALASSAPAENVDLILASLGIRQMFDATVTEQDVKAGKPDPEIFLTAARRVGGNPADCLVIEDAVVGVEAAKRAGMKCVAVSNTHPRDRLVQADVVVDSLQQLTVDRIIAILGAKQK